MHLRLNGFTLWRSIALTPPHSVGAIHAMEERLAACATGVSARNRSVPGATSLHHRRSAQLIWLSPGAGTNVAQ